MSSPPTIPPLGILIVALVGVCIGEVDGTMLGEGGFGSDEQEA